MKKVTVYIIGGHTTTHWEEACGFADTLASVRRETIEIRKADVPVADTVHCQNRRPKELKTV